MYPKYFFLCNFHSQFYSTVCRNKATKKTLCAVKSKSNHFKVFLCIKFWHIKKLYDVITVVKEFKGREVEFYVECFLYDARFKNGSRNYGRTAYNVKRQKRNIMFFWVSSVTLPDSKTIMLQ